MKQKAGKSLKKLNIIAIIILIIFNFNFVGMVLFNTIERSDPLTALCYKTDLKYIQTKYNYNNEYFPNELPQDISECSFQFMPPMLQGTGYKTLTFKASDDVFDQYLNLYSNKSILPAFTVAEYNGLSESEILANLNNYVSLDYDVTIKDFNLRIPENIKDNHPNTEIYVMYTNYNWNHPHSFCACFDKDTNLIVLSEIG